MKVIATNIGKATTIIWNGKEEKTGIFKYPTKEPILLGKEEVTTDTVIDRKHHAGVNKACYIFSSDHYNYWKNSYPDLEWNWGMFGENLTVEGWNEEKIRIGNIYKIGTALVQVSQPREPCYKLGVRFKNQAILKQFIDHGFPGTYVRVLENGTVASGDKIELVEESSNSLTIKQFYALLFSREKDLKIVQLAIDNPALPEYKRERLKKYL